VDSEVQVDTLFQGKLLTATCSPETAINHKRDVVAGEAQALPANVFIVLTEARDLETARMTEVEEPFSDAPPLTVKLLVITP